MPWKPRDEWERALQGDGCPICADMHTPVNTSGTLVATLDKSVVRLPFNQHARGWVVVAFNRHATELHHLSPEELAGFWQDVARTAAALSKVLNPVKINYAIFGNICPHIHCHLLPRFADHEPSARLFIDMEADPRTLLDADYTHLLEHLCTALSGAPPSSNGKTN